MHLAVAFRPRPGTDNRASRSDRTGTATTADAAGPISNNTVASRPRLKASGRYAVDWFVECPALCGL